MVFLIVLIFYSPCYSNNTFKPNGFCSVPVADLLGAPIKSFFKITPAHQAYKHIPYGDKRGDFACPRMAQLIFNELVEILEKKGDEIKIRVPHIKYPANNKWHDTYWTLASNITPFSSSIRKFIPSDTSDTITLKKTLYNPQTQLVYPAGTKFVKTFRRRSRHRHSVHIYDAQSKTVTLGYIPKAACVVIDEQDTQNQQQYFVSLCKEWAHQKDKFIPYVFGGSSISPPLKHDTFITKKVTFTPKSAVFYERPSADQDIRMGVDCARIFTRAAQMSGIPLYATNTKAFKKTLRSLKKGEMIQEGDLVLWRGHIVMISNVEKGLLVEARSYDDGYGKVHEIPFSEQLEGINTTQDLANAHFLKPRITRLNKMGKKSHFIYDLEILKLSSIWENTNA